ncbi:negative regulator of hrp expression HrpV [Pseudomonas cucumis]|uniref:Negative regulator of hrp expression HrpV n=1 Tax=Pseudomonas cucumis TaxID=2954082 RepID=A0ABY9EQ61_9PSED|nr:negative regulator of hrp expression HrpV [Pseudomonas cucumis]WLG82449.1 negative regulator of hrp expression HrpV [Pseudomonas cucumis]WLG88018.1 negative regulator of hrp expression HrpV [Pseudomonas cucumis]
MNEVIIQSADQHSFITHVGDGRASVWQWAPGIELVFREEGVGWGIALNIRHSAQRPNLFSDTLKRRFEDVETFDGYYICLDSQHTFVIWHALPCEQRSSDALEQFLAQVLELAGLKH